MMSVMTMTIGKWWSWWALWFLMRMMTMMLWMMMTTGMMIQIQLRADDIWSSRKWIALQSDFYPENGWTAEIYSQTVIISSVVGWHFCRAKMSPYHRRSFSKTFNPFGTILCNTIRYPFVWRPRLEYLAPGFVGELLDTILCNTEFTFHRNICQIFKHKVPIYHVTYGAGFSSALIFLFTHCLHLQ